MKAGKLVFDDRCSACHPPERALKADYDGEEWRRLVEDMLEGKESLTDGERSAVLLFLETAGSFNRKCVVCHDRDRCVRQGMDLDGWTMTIRKMKLRMKGGISAKETASIAAYLAATCPEG